MFRTLYAKLALVLIALLTAVGAVCIGVVVYTTRVYQQEMIQQLHRSLAANLAQQPLPGLPEEIEASMIGEWFRVFTVANPSIEIYLLDLDGGIVAHSTQADQIHQTQVSLEPILQFIADEEGVSILGDDPREDGRHKPFSAAAIVVGGKTRGYLYAILGGERYASAAQLIQRSQVLRLSITLLAAASLLGLVAGIFLFRMLTSRLHRLSTVIAEFQETGAAPRLGRRMGTGLYAGDEVDRLETSFDALVERITEQVAMLEKADIVRRELIAGVSHDLRTPLTTLRGYLETLLIMESDLSDAERRSYIESAIKHGQRLSSLIGSLAELARLDAPEMKAHIEAFPLAEIVQDVVQKFRLAASNQGAELIGSFSPDLPMVYADIELIERVFENLIENALRYTPQGGTITLDLGSTSDGIRVSVSDTGAGIPPEMLPHIFDRFYRHGTGIRGKSEGMGLGLAITRRILEIHGSSISVDSKVGHGTTFSFELSSRPANS